MTSRQILDEANIPPAEQGRAFTVIEASVQSDYLDLLFPMAIDYSATFMEEYFKRRIEVLPAGNSRFRLRNLMVSNFRFVNGTPLVAYEGDDGLRHALPIMCDGAEDVALELIAAANPSESATPSDFTYGLPEMLNVKPVDRGDYWLVLRGESVGNFGIAVSSAELEAVASDGFSRTTSLWHLLACAGGA